MSFLNFYIYSEFVGIFILLVWAIYLPFRGGQLYNGPIYCMLIGGFISAYASKNLNWPFGLALLLGVVIGTIIGFLTSFAFSRTTGIVSATASLCIIFILISVLNSTNIFGGPMGIMGLPRIGYLPIVIWIFVLLIGVFVYRIDYSRTGRALEATRTDPDLAKSLGVNLQQLSVYMMSIASMIGALAGGLFAFTIGDINPSMFGFTVLLNTMAMLFIGGRYTMWGILISAPILYGLPQWVPSSIATYMNLIMGMLLIITLMARPEGIVSRELIQHLEVWGKSLFRQNKESSPTNLEK